MRRTAERAARTMRKLPTRRCDAWLFSRVRRASRLPTRVPGAVPAECRIRLFHVPEPIDERGGELVVIRGNRPLVVLRRECGSGVRAVLQVPTFELARLAVELADDVCRKGIREVRNSGELAVRDLQEFP